MKKFVECEHCKGKKMCTVSGGRSCHTCLAAAGRKRRDWATVRCSFCGGRGMALVEVEEEAPKEEPKAEEAPQAEEGGAEKAEEPAEAEPDKPKPAKKAKKARKARKARKAKKRAKGGGKRRKKK